LLDVCNYAEGREGADAGRDQELARLFVEAAGLTTERNKKGDRCIATPVALLFIQTLS
jgi:hypothetical protein